jgi:hypothetical protein
MSLRGIVSLLFSSALVLSATAADSPPADIIAEYLAEFRNLTLNRSLLTTAADRYNDRFWEHLTQSGDRELKRKFVLIYLCSTLESEVDCLARGEVFAAKDRRKLTRGERIRAVDSIKKHLRDLAFLDPEDTFQAGKELQSRLVEIENKKR